MEVIRRSLVLDLVLITGTRHPVGSLRKVPASFSSSPLIIRNIPANCKLGWENTLSNEHIYECISCSI